MYLIKASVYLCGKQVFFIFWGGEGGLLHVFRKSYENDCSMRDDESVRQDLSELCAHQVAECVFYCLVDDPVI